MHVLRAESTDVTLESDFVLAFEAGRLIEAARTHLDGQLQETGGREATQLEEGHGASQRSQAPTFVIVTADEGLQVVADEMQQCGVCCKLVKNVGELGEMLRAMDILANPGAGGVLLKPR